MASRRQVLWAGGPRIHHGWVLMQLLRDHVLLPRTVLNLRNVDIVQAYDLVKAYSNPPTTCINSIQ